MDTDSSTEIPTGPHIDVKDGYLRMVDPKTGEVLGYKNTCGLERISNDERLKRDEEVIYCTKHLKMTISQIHRYSWSWKYPIGNYQHAWDICERLGLLARVKKNSQRQSMHEKTMLEFLIRLASDAKDCEREVTEVSKEHRIGVDSRIRADLRLKIGSRLYYVECQSSSLTFVGWKQKLGKYDRYRTKVKEPFRVLVVFDEQKNLTTIRGYARDVIRNPNRTLFYFCTYGSLERNCVSRTVWQTHRSREYVSLLD